MNFVYACAITVAAETAFFALIGFRDRAFITVCILANVATNLSLNLLLWWFYTLGLNTAILVYPLEIAAVFTEFAVYAALRAPSGKLLFLTAAANAISYTLGLLLFGHV